jgi:chromosome partitioning protein
MHNPRTVHAREVLESLKKYFTDMVFNTVIKETVKFKESSVGGYSILEYAESSDAAQAYRKLTMTISKVLVRLNTQTAKM